MEEGHHGVKIVVELPKPAGNLFEWSISQRRPLCDLQALDLVDLFDEPTPIRVSASWFWVHEVPSQQLTAPTS